MASHQMSISLKAQNQNCKWNRICVGCKQKIVILSYATKHVHLDS